MAPPECIFSKVESYLHSYLLHWLPFTLTGKKIETFFYVYCMWGRVCAHVCCGMHCWCHKSSPRTWLSYQVHSKFNLFRLCSRHPCPLSHLHSNFLLMATRLYIFWFPPLYFPALPLTLAVKDAKKAATFILPLKCSTQLVPTKALCLCCDIWLERYLSRSWQWLCLFSPSPSRSAHSSPPQRGPSRSPYLNWHFSVILVCPYLNFLHDLPLKSHDYVCMDFLGVGTYGSLNILDPP